MLSGCDADTGDEHGVGSGISRPNASLAVNADSGAIADETAVISTAPASTIDFNDGKLSVSLNAIPLHRAMTEVSRQTGIEIQFVGEHHSSKVNMEFDGYPVEKGLRLLLDDVNTILVYADTVEGESHGKQLAKVFILPEGESSNVNNGIDKAVETLSGISEQIKISVPLSTNDAKAHFPLNDNFTGQALDKLTETLSKRLSMLGQLPNQLTVESKE